MKTLIKSALLIASTLFFMANANAETFITTPMGKIYIEDRTLNTNISGLVLKEMRCTNIGNYRGRWVNRNNQSLGDKRVKISMYDSDGDRTGVQSTYIIDMGAKTGGQFFTSTDDSPCRPSYSITFFVE